MKQKVANQTAKKNFILYKGHTGWKIKTRLFGTLLVSLSAVAIAESTGTVDVHAATETPAATASQEPTPTTTGTVTLNKVVSQELTTQEPAAQELVTQEPVQQEKEVPQEPVTKDPVQSEESTVQEKPAAQAEPAQKKAAAREQVAPVAESAAYTPTDTATYQTLTPDQQVNVNNTDGSSVTLSGSQVQDHFTNTVQNFSKASSAATAKGDESKNTTVQPADPATGVWQLTTNGTHDFWSAGSGSYLMHIAGPQTAHVSFEHEIDFGHDFSMTGALGIGTKTTGGADGVGIVFAPGDPKYATTGLTGGNLGLGGLNNAFAFVYDDHHNAGDDTSGVVDPGSGAYFGWRSTDANGVIQNVTDSTAWKAASAFDLSNRATDPLIGFTMTYESLSKKLSVTIQGQTFTRALTDIDTSKGYSISIAASTGQDTNDYSARIDNFTYTPKTASVNVTVADTTVGDTPVSTTTPVTANIGDTISVFSTKAAAERAVAADPTLDPKLITVIPASTTANVYVVNGDQATASNGTVHYIGGDSSTADGAYYSYTVTGDTTQALTVPISQAFTANVTPVDSVTGDPIPGIDPIQVTSVAGKSVVIQVPGYTPVTVVLNAPAAGQTVANDNVKINTSTTPSTSTDVANPIEHYYTATGETIDGTKVTANATVGTNQSVTDTLNAQIATDGATAGITGDDYYWSTVPNAAGTDSTDKANPQSSTSILVPTKLTLDKWLQKAADNQTNADTQQAKAQDIYNQFIGKTGVTQDQKDAAKQLLDSVTDLYDKISTANTTAKTALEAAEASTDPATIVKDAQDGYNAIANLDDSMNIFQTDLDNLTNASQDSLASFVSWSQTYGTTLGFPEVTFGSGFGATVTDAQKQDFNNPDYFYYVNALDSTDQVTPKNAGTYYFKLTDAGRTYLKSLTPNTNAGFYVSAAVTITPAAATPTITNTNMVYGGVDGKLAGVTGSLGSTLADTDHPATQDEFEIVDANGDTVPVDQLQVGGDYTIRYTAAAQTALKADGNYTFGDFGTAKLTVTPRDITVTAPTVTKSYGESEAIFKLAGVSVGELVNNDQLSDLGVTLERNAGEDVGTYKIILNSASKLNKNYKITVTPGLLTINKKSITVKATDVNATYDGTAPKTDGFSLAPGDTLVGDDTIDALGVTLNPISEVNAGTYTDGITGTATSKNYDVTVDPGTLTIAPAASSLNLAAANMVYGDAFPTFTATNNVPGTTSTITAADFEVVNEAGTVVNAGQAQANGKYTLQLTQAAKDRLNAENPNDTITFGTNVLTVNKRPITVNVNDVNTAYDGQAHGANGFTIASGEALANGDSNDALGITLNPISETNAGMYTIAGKADSANYAVTLADGTLNITPAAANVAVKGTSVVYGNSLPSLSVTVNGVASDLSADNFEIVDTTTKSVVTADQLQANGDYTVQLTKAAQDVLNKANGNYTLSFGTAALTVTKRPITVNINDVTTAYDGQAHGANGFTIASGTDNTLADGDSNDALGVTLDSISKTDAGTYDITGSADSANYAVTLEKGTLKIGQVAADVTVGDAESTYDDSALPQLSATVSVPGNTIAQSDFEIIDNVTGKSVAAADLQAGGNYTIQLNQAAKTRLAQANSNYDFTNYGTGKLTVAKRAVTVTVKSQVMNAGESTPENQATLTVAGSPVHAQPQLDLNYVEPDSQEVGTYTIGATSDNSNYALTVLPGQLTVLGKDTDANGNVTITEKDSAGNVVKIDKQWTDGSQTTYTYDPTTDTRTVSEQKNGTQVDQQQLTTDSGKVTLADDTNTSTIVALDPTTKQPTFEHDTTQTVDDTTTTKDDAGNVVKVIKQWTDGSQTTYIYDPTTGNRTVAEQKDGQTVDQQTIAPDATTATLASGVGVKTIVDAGQPGSQPTFEHDTTQTATDKFGNVTATTKDATGDVVKVTKQWTDGTGTTYVYDPTTGKQTVTEQRGSQTVDQQSITPDSLKATLASGNGVETIVGAEPGSEPTFAHNTTQTATDKAGNVTATTKDIAGDVIKVTKQWTDGSQTTYTYDPATGDRTVAEQKDGTTVEQKTIAPDSTEATVSSGVGVETIVDTGQPGSEPTFAHNTTQTATDKSGNVTATTKDANGNAIKVTKQWTDGGETTYTYDPTTGSRSVTEQKDGKLTDQQTIAPDDTQATLASGDGIETIVDTGKSGSEPTFEHETTVTTPDKSGTTTTDANGNIVKVTKQWTDGSETIYTYDPASGARTVSEQRNGKTVDQKQIDPDASEVTLSDGAGGTAIVKFSQSDTEPTFTHNPAIPATTGNVPTTDADKVVKITKQWPDGVKIIYTYDPATGNRVIREFKDGDLVAQRTATAGASSAVLPDGMGGSITVKLDESGTGPTFTRQLADKLGARKEKSGKKSAKKARKSTGATKAKGTHKQLAAGKTLARNESGRRQAQSPVISNVAYAGDTATTGRAQSQEKTELTTQQEAKQQQTELPQTGQKNENFLAQLGAILLALLITPFVRRRSH